MLHGPTLCQHSAPEGDSPFPGQTCEMLTNPFRPHVVVVGQPPLGCNTGYVFLQPHPLLLPQIQICLPLQGLWLVVAVIIAAPSVPVASTVLAVLTVCLIIFIARNQFPILYGRG